ncbi:hypothetical protein [Arthrobacter sp. ISL-5]|uniref:hypothetical protein n=1 Tax=Arthrobacter sp. ISL-5 TaxID=2819111 RepID=UPI001BE581DB|nr:hypothetical protein [Arthrobacter sp. ISL-5]MBT2551477.1 hypothetical protein [Arthrobacter sp. ISL-5]
MLVPSLPASASGPDVPEAPSYIPVGYACPDFNLGFTWTGGDRAWSRAFTDNDGFVTRIMSTSSDSMVTYINYGSDPLNPVAGKTYTAKMTGSGVRTDFGAGTQTITLTGDNYLSRSGPDIPGGVSSTLHTGRVVFIFDNTTGALEVVSGSGRELDLCAALR